MAAKIQLDFFKETTEVDILKAEIAALTERQENVRKGLFARHNALAKMLLAQQEELDYLKCRVGLACQVK